MPRPPAVEELWLPLERVPLPAVMLADPPTPPSELLEAFGFLLRPPTRPPLRLIVLVSESSILRPAVATAGKTLHLTLFAGARAVLRVNSADARSCQHWGGPEI